ncbi:Cation/acetate symporter ActP [Arthrobacter ulcerisalmonis]|uniref:Cation/acetate symporter ActP n=1 Tax=Arthrobacter ulcerisalmonis TaxID=2483813 RepID=A0A3P5XHM6_9MICC|nr:cation acetate symporter [Arthrobacter ulcerisalmonis]VDC30382.1 Cation/acetate symporter ActP [Arthrobacter ulcerisalmonis]
MKPGIALLAVAVVSLATAAIGFYGLRVSRTTGDFYVASRTVPPWWNASAIGGEYLSAASFLGVAGLILLSGTDALWFPVGYTAGYLMLLLFVAAPLRRSGAYTIPDFTEARLDSVAVRKVTSVVVVLVGWLYIVPQLHGAALTIRISTGLPSWAGSVAVVVVVCLTVVSGGMRSITFVQAFQYWLKLTALALPILFIIFVLAGTNTPAVAAPDVNPGGAAPAGLYQNVSLLVALLFGTLGLPHVLVRFYTNPDGQSARRTTLIVLGLLSVFYLFPTAYGYVGRMFTPGLAGQADAAVLLMPGTLVGGTAGDLLSALVVAGAFAAFLSTTSGLVVSLAGVINQDVLGGGVGGFRVAAVISAVVPLGFALMTDSLALAGSVGLVFAFTASTVCPVLLLGIWWRGLTDVGAIAGMVTGGLLCGGAMIAGAIAGAANIPGWLAQPAAWTVPAAFAVMVLVSRATARRVPGTMARVMTRLHTPERPLATER